MTDFSELWKVQIEQQADLGLDPKHMTSVEKRRLTADLVLQLHEEATELGRLTSTYKRHLLADQHPHDSNVAEEVADILKVTLALAQLHGLPPESVVEAFLRKTDVVASRARGERLAMRRDTKLVCVDMDDVISDLDGWMRQLRELRGGEASNHWALLESHKDEFYNSGRFLEMPPVAGAPEGMRELKERGHTLVIITARPQWQYKRLYADTLEWLKRYNVPHDHILFNKDKVEAVFEHLKPAWPKAFIEDMPRNAIGLADAGIPVLLLDTSRNQGLEHQNITRVYNWAQILEKLA
jgi:NTP pyrophosphatase (non-canonical NTP hydrolase)